MHPNDAEGIPNSVDPDHTAPLFAQAYLSENLGSLRYAHMIAQKYMYIRKMLRNAFDVI